MKKTFNIKNLIVIALAAITITSCNNDDQEYPDPNKPVVTVSSSTLTLTEGESGVITLNLSHAISSPVDLKLMPVSGDAEKDVDYSVTTSAEYTSPDDGVGPVPAYHVVIPTGVTTYDIPVSAIDDLDAEENESVTFELSSTGNGIALVAEDSQTLTLNITNNTANFVTTLAWSGTYIGEDGAEHEFCDSDLDLEIYNADYTEYAATSYSNCPESIVIAPSELADGDYWIVPSFWAVHGTAPAENVNIPARLIFSQAGTTSSETVDLGDLWDLETGGYADTEDLMGSYLFDAYKLTVSGSSFTVTGPDGSVIFQQ